MAHLTCKLCQRRFTWKPDFIGKVVRCRCGATMRCPDMPESATPAYDLADIAAAPATATPAPPPVKILPYRSAPTATATELDPDRLKNLHLPAALLGGGVIIATIAAFLERHHLTDALQLVALRIGVGTVLMLAGMYAATLLRGLRLGSFWTVAFKLAAITVAPGAVVNLLYPLVEFIPILGPLFGLAVHFVLYFALLGVLFDLDESDTWYCVWVMFLIDVGVFFLLQA